MVLMEQFAVLRKLGRGGWATVYEADQTTMDRKVAIKVLHRELLSEQEAVHRFFQEARSASRLDHPNILRPWLVGQLEDGTPYLVMDVVEGPTLADVMKEEGALPLERALHIALQIAWALDEAASRGVVHRDLKPSNIFLAIQGRRSDVVRLADFGIAKVLTDDAGAGLTRTGDILGTPAYMAPEQASGTRVDHRADVYAFGVLLYRMLSGEYPFEEQSVMTLLAAHVGKPPRPLHAVMPSDTLPAGLHELVMAMLAKSPDERPQTAGEVAEALAAIGSRAGLSVGDTTLGATTLQSAADVPEQEAPAAGSPPGAPASGMPVQAPPAEDVPSAPRPDTPGMAAPKPQDASQEWALEATDLAAPAWTPEAAGLTPPGSLAEPPGPEPPPPEEPSLYLRGGGGEPRDEEDDIATVATAEDMAEGLIPLCGTGQPGYAGDGGPGTQALFCEPTAIAQDVHGSVFIVDRGNHCVRFLDARGGVVRTLIGMPEESGFGGDDGPADEALLNEPAGIALDAMGNLYVADRGNRRVRAVDVRSGGIGTVVGNGRVGPSPDGVPAHQAGLVPEALALGPDGGLFVADAANHKVWRVDPRDGLLATYAGVGDPGGAGDGGPARSAALHSPMDLAFDPLGVLYIADYGNGRIRAVDPQTGRLETVAGGDGTLGAPVSVTAARDGSLRVADAEGGRVLAVDPRTGVAETLAGDFVDPRGIWEDPQGTLMVADTGRHRVWAIIEK